MTRQPAPLDSDYHRQLAEASDGDTKYPAWIARQSRSHVADLELGRVRFEDVRVEDR
jgi:hypothetical protein